MYNVSVFVTNGRGSSAAVSKRVLSKEAGLTQNYYAMFYCENCFISLSVSSGTSTNSSPSKTLLVNLVTLPYILQLFIGDSSSSAILVAAGIIIFAVLVIIIATVIMFIIR